MKQLLTLLFIGLTSLYAQTVPSYVPTNGLVGWWPFNGNANDESGNGNNFNIYGPSLTSDRFSTPSSAYSFNGLQASAEILQLTPVPSSISSAHSTSLWFTTSQFYPNQQPSNPYDFNNFNVQGLISVNPNNWNIGPALSYTLNFDNSKIETGHWTSSGTGGSIVSASIISTNQWYNLTVVYDGTISTSYLNGNQIMSFNASFSLSNQIDLVVGGLRNGPSMVAMGGFKGKIDDIGLWSRALNQQEILSLYLGCTDSIMNNPQNFTAYSSTGWANFKCESSDTAATYQWQQSNGAGWSNLSNLGNYSGATSDSLVIIGVTSTMNNYGYRCIVASCTTDTSDVAVLTVANGIGLGESSLQKLTVSPNPTNGLVSLNAVVLGTYELLTLEGRILESGTAKKDYDLTKYPTGVYHIRLSTDEGTRVLKVVKN